MQQPLRCRERPPILHAQRILFGGGRLQICLLRPIQVYLSGSPLRGLHPEGQDLRQRVDVRVQPAGLLGGREDLSRIKVRLIRIGLNCEDEGRRALTPRGH